MSFVQRDDMVQDLSATTSNPSLRGSILPGRLDARPLRFQTRRLQKRNHGGIEFRIAVQDQITVWPISGKASRSGWTTHSALGCRVTLKCRIRRRPCSMTKKQYSN